MTKLYYLRGALGDTRLLEEHLEPIKKLLNGDYIANNLEQLHGHNIYSYRLSDKARLLFAIHEFDNRPCLVVLDYLPTHDYHKSRFLRSGVLKNYLMRQETAYSSINELSFVPCSSSNKLPVFTLPGEADAVSELTLDYYQHRFITLNSEQQEACDVPLPALVSGVAGSGKSCVALSLLADYFSKHLRTMLDGDTRPVLYVSKSKPLVNSMRRAWGDLPLAQEMLNESKLPLPTAPVLFMTYEQLLQSEDEVTREYAVVGENEFASWYAVYLDTERTRARATKTAYQELDVSTVYQEFRIASGYSQDDYQRLGAKQSSIKEPSQRIWLYEIYKKYLSILAKERQLNPDFYQFKPKNCYPLVVADEAQDLSYKQLRQLGQCAAGSIVFCIDSHQRLHDSHSVRPFLLEHFNIKEASHIELQVSHRCPMRVVTVANQVIALKHRLVGGLADKREPMRIDRSASEHDLGHVFMMSPDSVLKNTWVQAQIAQPYCAIVTSEAHLEEARKYFHDSLLIFTPQTIKGLEYDIVIAWKLYKPSVMAEARRRSLLLSESKSTHPMHRPKEGTGERHFGPEFNEIYTSYTRPKQVLIISEESSRDNQLLLELLGSLTDRGTPSEDTLHQQYLSRDWEQQILKLLDVGNDRLALTIFMSKLGKPEEQFHPWIARFSQRSAVVVEESKKPMEESKRPMEEPREESKKSMEETKRSREISKKPIEEFKRVRGEFKRSPEAKDKNLGMSSSSSSAKIPTLIMHPKQYKASQAKTNILMLEKDFTSLRLKLTISSFDKGIWLHHYGEEKQNKTVVLADLLLLQDEYWLIFTSLLVNNYELLLKTPLEEILAHLDKKLYPTRFKSLVLEIENYH